MKKTFLTLCAIVVCTFAAIPAFSQISKNSFDGRNYTDDQIIKINNQGYYFTYLGYTAQNTSFSTSSGDVSYYTDTEFKQKAQFYFCGRKIKASEYLYGIGMDSAAREYEKYENKVKKADAWTLGLGIPGVLALVGGGIGAACTTDGTVANDACTYTWIGGSVLTIAALIPCTISVCSKEPELQLDLVSAQTAKKNKELLNF